MTNVVDRLLLKVEVQLHNAQTGFKTLNAITTKAGVALATYHQRASAITNAMQPLKGAMLGAGMSMLFSGMAFLRYFSSILNSLFSTFMTVEGETGVVNEGINEIVAALLFLKFSLIDAFVESGIFDAFKNSLLWIIEKFTEMPDPVKAILVLLIVLGVIFTAVMMIAGQVILGFLGIFALLEMHLLIPIVIIGLILDIIFIIASD